MEEKLRPVNNSEDGIITGRGSAQADGALTANATTNAATHAQSRDPSSVLSTWIPASRQNATHCDTQT
jgi:hypothetical protein